MPHQEMTSIRTTKWIEEVTYSTKEKSSHLMTYQKMTSIRATKWIEEVTPSAKEKSSHLMRYQEMTSIRTTKWIEKVTPSAKEKSSRLMTYQEMTSIRTKKWIEEAPPGDRFGAHSRYRLSVWPPLTVCLSYAIDMFAIFFHTIFVIFRNMLRRYYCEASRCDNEA